MVFLTDLFLFHQTVYIKRTHILINIYGKPFFMLREEGLK